MSRIEEAKEGASNDDADFARLTKELEELGAEMDSINHRKKKIQLISDQVGGWTSRVAIKMSEQLTETGEPIRTDGKTFVEIYKEINELVKDQLEIIRHEQAARAREEGEDEDRESINGKDYMNDFATEEFVTKNIRVMPMGGMPIDNQSEHTSKYYPSHMGGTAADSDVEDNKYNRDEKLEIMNKRQKVKEKK